MYTTSQICPRFTDIGILDKQSTLSSMEPKKMCCLGLVILELSTIYYVETLQISHNSSKVGVSSVIQCTSDNGNGMDWIVDGTTVGICSGSIANSCLPACTECSSVIGSPANTFSYTINTVGYANCIKYGCREGNTGLLSEFTLEVTETLQISHNSSKVGVSSVIQCTSDNGNGMDWIVDGTTVGICSGSIANSCLPACTECSSVIGSPANTFSYTINTVGYANCIKYGCREGNTGLLSEFTLEVTDFSVDNSTAVLNPQEPTANTDGNVSITTPCIFPTSSDSITINWYKIFVNKANQAELLDTSNADIQSYNDTDTTGCSTCNTKPAGKMTVGVTYKHPSSNGDEIKLQVEIIHADFTDHLYYTFDRSYYLPVCDCKVLKIVWSVLFIVFSTGSGAWILYVLFAVPKARKWLTEKLCAPTHLCMIGWIFVSFVYSIIAVILYNILVCKDESSEADCWPVYLIIGIVVKGGDVAVSLLALLAFLNGVDKGDAGRKPPERRNNKSKVRNDPASHITHRSEPPVSTQHKDAKAKEAMDSQRPQPLPPVGQQGHGRGLSANLGDQYDNMPLVSQKNVLPPLGAVGEDGEVKKSKKKKSKKKREEDDIV
ncbi:uncharacterized protein LOC128235121 isoform X3 [Mya arenaria]|uniref:uncharacterized protein LOC128235121 isoform X3 n=1 Tax=Mya arenaria TaxID=6604 RepID=UPI0022E321A2|nr:uncharacterized protein LOC128235121 isoform X3 [Mya arenaria]